MSWLSEHLAKNPVGGWRLGEAAGDFADSVGANDGTLTGTPSRGVTGAFSGDRAVSLDGSSYISIPDDAGFSIVTTGELSVELWVKPSSVSSSVIAAKTGNGNQYEWAVGSADGFFANVWALDGSAAAFGSWGLFVDGAWRHVVVTFDSSNQILGCFIDGVEQAADNDAWTAVPADGTGGIDIGRRPDGVSPLTGDVSEVWIYASVLTAQEVADLYAARLSRRFAYKTLGLLTP